MFMLCWSWSNGIYQEKKKLQCVTIVIKIMSSDSCFIYFYFFKILRESRWLKFGNRSAKYFKGLFFLKCLQYYFSKHYWYLFKPINGNQFFPRKFLWKQNGVASQQNVKTKSTLRNIFHSLNWRETVTINHSICSNKRTVISFCKILARSGAARYFLKIDIVKKKKSQIFLTYLAILWAKI